jgi:hypothetical protein
MTRSHFGHVMAVFVSVASGTAVAFTGSEGGFCVSTQCL